MAKKNLWNYPHVIDIFADELFHDLSEYGRGGMLYEQFFIERTANARDLYSQIEMLEESLSPRNIFILGDKGVGKSTFLQWFISNPKYFGARGSSSLLVDLRRLSESKEGDSLVRLAQVEIIQAIKNFCKDYHNNPTNELPVSDDLDTDVKAAMAFNKACSIMNSYDNDKRRFFTLFLDDIDYADADYVPPLIRCLRSLLPLRNCHCVFAGRPAAYNSIIAGLPDNFGGAVFGRDNPVIRLPHLLVEDILKVRLQVICPQSPVAVKDIAPEWNRKLSTRPRILRSIQNLFTQPELPEDLKTIEYPFTRKQHNSTQHISNGNIGYVLEIARQLMIYMSRHRKAKAHLGYHIGRRSYIDCFSNKDIKAAIQIQNLHKVKSHQYMTSEEARKKGIPPEALGNSLYVCLLESLLDFDSYDLTVKYLKTLGFDKDDVDRGINALINMQMLEESQIIDRRPLTLANIISEPAIVQEYKVTLRGVFYINFIIHWTDYIAKYGISNHHRKRYDLVTVETIRYYLVALAVSIFIQRQNLGIIHYSFKVAKREFWRFFMDSTEDIRKQLDKTTQRATVTLTSADVERHLRSLGIVQITGLVRSNRYLFSTDKTSGLVASKHMPNTIQYPFDTNKLEAFVRAYVQTPEEEET